MHNNHLLKCPSGSVFTSFEEKTLRKLKADNPRLIAISGSIKQPGIIEVPPNATLLEIIQLAGGLTNKSEFKAAQIGIPYGHLLTKKDLNECFDWKLFKSDMCPQIIILSMEDCIVQYSKSYLEFLLYKMEIGSSKYYANVRNEIMKMYDIIENISKGVSSMQDIYHLREYAEIVSTQSEIHLSIILDVIHFFYDELTEHIENKRCYTFQCNHLTKITITTKCIGCDMCTAVCPVDCIVGAKKEQHYIDYKRCTHCGACISVCPVSAITSGNNSTIFLRDLAAPDKIVITQMAPSVRVALGEAFGFEPGENVQYKIAAGLKELGVDYVFDTTWAADLTIMEEASELQERIERYLAGDETVRLPILTSCCPAWVKFIEQNYNDMLDVPSTAKSPMQMFAAVAKNIWAKEKGFPRDKVISVAIMPCVAKKYEASRIEFSSGLNYDVDYVITTSELIDIFKSSGIDLAEIEDGTIDPIMGEYTGAGIIFGRTGGVIEAATRTAVEKMTGKRLDNIEFTCLRGWDSFRSCELEVGDLKLKIGITYGLKEAAKMLDKIRSGEEFYHAIEIMACTNGCVGGGGQPKTKGKRADILAKRAEGLNHIDRSKDLRRSNENPEVLAIYEKYLGHPLSHKAHELLHTKYFPKKNY